jgi:hypothetical protein
MSCGKPYCKEGGRLGNLLSNLLIFLNLKKSPTPADKGPPPWKYKDIKILPSVIWDPSKNNRVVWDPWDPSGEENTNIKGIRIAIPSLAFLDTLNCKKNSWFYGKGLKLKIDNNYSSLEKKIDNLINDYRNNINNGNNNNKNEYKFIAYICEKLDDLYNLNGTAECNLNGTAKCLLEKLANSDTEKRVTIFPDDNTSFTCQGRFGQSGIGIDVTQCAIAQLFCYKGMLIPYKIEEKDGSQINVSKNTFNEIISKKYKSDTEDENYEKLAEDLNNTILTSAFFPATQKKDCKWPSRPYFNSLNNQFQITVNDLKILVGISKKEEVDKDGKKFEKNKELPPLIPNRPEWHEADKCSKEEHGIELLDALKTALIYHLYKDSDQGMGVSSSVKIDVKQINGNDGISDNYLKIRLAHELIHAYYNNIGGQPYYDNDPKGGSLNDFICIGLGPWEKEKITENKIRNQLHLDEREIYFNQSFENYEAVKDERLRLHII